MASRAPDVVIGQDYLQRWHLVPRNRRANLYLHAFHRSDDDRALHDHPWPSVSLLLSSHYWECVPARSHEPDGDTAALLRPLGALHRRPAHAAHRIELPVEYPDEPVITLFATGPKVREWGFWCPQGWRHWQDFTTMKADGSAERGCGEV